MFKKVVSIVVFALILSSFAAFADGSQINVIIDGEAMTFTEEYGFPVEQNDRVLLPFRQIFEKYGWMPVYDESTQTIIAVKDGGYMAMQIGSKSYHFGDNTVEFDTAPVEINWRTMVPVRVISEGLGFEVNYDDATRTVSISTK